MDNYKVYRLDNKNLCIDKYQKGINPKTKEVAYNWVRLGYWSTPRGVLQALVRELEKDFIDETKDIKDLIAKMEELEVNIEQKEFARQLMKDLGYNDKDPRH